MRHLTPNSGPAPARNALFLRGLIHRFGQMDDKCAAPVRGRRDTPNTCRSA